MIHWKGLYLISFYFILFCKKKKGHIRWASLWRHCAHQITWKRELPNHIFMLSYYKKKSKKKSKNLYFSSSRQVSSPSMASIARPWQSLSLYLCHWIHMLTASDQHLHNAPSTVTTLSFSVKSISLRQSQAGNCAFLHYHFELEGAWRKI